MSDAPRTRSRSPRPSKKSTSGGFKWKEKPRRDGADNENNDTSKRLERGYRDRDDDFKSRRRERDDERNGCGDERRRDERRGEGREREGERRRDRDEEGREYRDRETRTGDGGGRDGRKDRDGEGGAIGGTKHTKTPIPAPQAPLDDSIASKFGLTASTTTTTNPTTINPSAPTTSSSTSAPSRAAATGPMIVIKINDRLGTASKVPCLASDTIGDLKKLVAMRIGRKPHEIMLKRQSERPFKDFLTLADYGVSDGVQLDLEIDTGG